MRIAYISIFITGVCFGTMEVACKIAGNNLDPFQLTFLRFALAGLLLLPFAIRELRANHIRLNAKDFLILMGLGALNLTSMTFFQLGIINSNATTAAILISASPFFTMVFAHFFTSEKFNRYKGLVLAIGLLGLLFMIRPWNIQPGNTVLGIVYLLIASISFGGYTVAGKVSVQKLGLMAQTSISFLFGSFFLFIVVLIMGRPVIAGVGSNIWILLYAAIIVTGVGYFFYFLAIRHSDASTGSLAFFIKAVIAPIMAVIFLHEELLWNTYIGIILILAASYINIRYQRKENELKDKLECRED